MGIINIKHGDFDKIITSSKPVFIDFWAPWCTPCKMIAPTIEEIAVDNEDRIVVGKVNIDEEPELASQFGVMSIPTLVLLKAGKTIATSVGVKSKAAIQQMIDRS